MTDTYIHPTAIIENGAKIGADVQIGPYCVVHKNVKLHDRVILKSHVVVDGHTDVGEGTVIYPFASIGSPPQDLKYAGEPSQLVIGKNNVIREHVTMNPGTASGAMKTIIGDNGLFMMAVHVAHDCVIGNNVIMANNATLAGHVVVGDFVLLGGLSAVHQFIRIGDYAVIGGMSAVSKDVIPFGRVKGDRAYLDGLNLVGLERGGFDKGRIRTLQKAFKTLFSQTDTMDARIEKVAKEYAQDDAVMKIVEFARAKDKFPLCQPNDK